MIDAPHCAKPYEGWFVDGVSIEKHGFLLSDFVETMPPRRGSDVTVARRPGVKYQPKVYGPRLQTLIVWALKEDEFGNVIGGHERNIDRLKRLFGGGVSTVDVTRRIQLPFNRVTSRLATVELVDALEGKRTALTQEGVYVQFSIDLLFQDPFWYEPENKLEQPDDDYGSFVLFNPGTVQHHNAIVRIYGPATDPEILMEPSGSRVKFDGSIGAGDWIELDSDALTAVDDSGTSVAGAIERDQVFFVVIEPGRNVATVTDGEVDFSWRPAFL